MTDHRSQNGFLPLPEIRQNDRVFLVGTTGSGKTTLAEQLLAQKSNLVILDPKHQFSSQRMERVWGRPLLVATNMRQLSKWRGPAPIIYRPSQTDTQEGCAGVFSWAYSRGNLTLYVDEVLPIVTTLRGAIWQSVEFSRCIQMGRTRNVGLWIATQRPARIPINILTESEHDFIFNLRNVDDRKRMAAYTDEQTILKRPTGHGFWYFSDRDQICRYFDRLNIRK